MMPVKAMFLGAPMAGIDSFSILISLSMMSVICNGAHGAVVPGISYWHEVFPKNPIPNTIRRLLPASTTLSAIALPPSSYYTTMSSPSMAPEPEHPYVRYWVTAPAPAPRTPHAHYSRHLAAEVAPNFFLRKSLEPQSEMNLTLMKPPRKFQTFMTVEQAESLHSFSLSNFHPIIQKLSLKPSSRGAIAVRRALELCSRPTTKQERRCCTLTLESMIDCAASILGTRKMHVAAITDSNGFEIENIEPKMYKVGSEGAKLISLRTVACHGIEFPNYALFYCHELQKTRSYMVSLEGDDGRKVNAPVVCHFDTSYWDPNHESFEVLGVEPGTVPICHFLSDGFAWVPDY